MKVKISITRREALVWGSLAIDVIVALYYFGHVTSLGLFEVLDTPALIGLVSRAVVLAIIISIVVFGGIYALTIEEPMDERDYRFQARANTAGYYMLTAGVVAVIGYMITHSIGGDIGGRAIFWTSTTTIIHLLVAVLVAASVLRSAARLFHYRMGG